MGNVVFRQTYTVTVLWTEQPGNSISNWQPDIEQVFREVAWVEVESTPRETLVPKT